MRGEDWSYSTIEFDVWLSAIYVYTPVLQVTCTFTHFLLGYGSNHDDTHTLVLYEITIISL